MNYCVKQCQVIIKFDYAVQHVISAILSTYGRFKYTFSTVQTTNQAYILHMLRSYIHIFCTSIHINIYLMFQVLQQTMNKFAQLFKDG
jgi:hypothetical protein